jgi:hypothetical protein
MLVDAILESKVFTIQVNLRLFLVSFTTRAQGLPNPEFCKIEATIRPEIIPNIYKAALNIGIQGFLVFDVRGYDVEGGSYVTTRMEVLVKKQLVEEMKLKIVGIGAISNETGAISDDHSLLQFNFKKNYKAR